MSLILAIEPDRRQTSKITALAKNVLHAELVAADTTEHAVAALGGRLPDLILTSLLLSAKDETALADWLRDLDAAGAHVQMLVIPVLGTARRRSRTNGGLLTRLTGKNRKDAAPDGCDPAVFATQISEYLERAAEEQKAAALARDDEVAPGDAAVEESATGPAAMAADMPRDEEPWSEIVLAEEATEGSEDSALNLELTSEPIDLDKFMEELAADACGHAGPPQRGSRAGGACRADNERRFH